MCSNSGSALQAKHLLALEYCTWADCDVQGVSSCVSDKLRKIFSGQIVVCTMEFPLEANISTNR